jgi:hypothetical protein
VNEVEVAAPASPPSEPADGPDESRRLLAQDLMPQRRSEPSVLMPVNVGREVPQLPWASRVRQSVRRTIDRASARLRVPRRALVGGLAAAVALLLVVSIVMCPGSSSGTKRSGPSGGSGSAPTAAKMLPARCVLLGRTCGQGEKRVTKITAECTKAAEQQIERGCAAAAITAYDCYAAKLCGKADPVWALDDLRVLSTRRGQCVAEGAAVRACIDKSTH